MTKQAMAELVAYLEAQGYVVRVPDPADRRAKLVLPTDRGTDVVRIAQALVPEVEEWIGTVLGGERARLLRADLETLHEAVSRGAS